LQSFDTIVSRDYGVTVFSEEFFHIGLQGFVILDYQCGMNHAASLMVWGLFGNVKI
jgi:hypothetical protein